MDELFEGPGYLTEKDENTWSIESRFLRPSGTRRPALTSGHVVGVGVGVLRL